MQQLVKELPPTQNVDKLEIMARLAWLHVAIYCKCSVDVLNIWARGSESQVTAAESQLAVTLTIAGAAFSCFAPLADHEALIPALRVTAAVGPLFFCLLSRLPSTSF